MQSADSSKTFAANLESIVNDKTVIFTASAGLRTFEANSFNTWIALSRARMFTKRWLASLPSTLSKDLYDLNHVSDILNQKISKTSDFP